MRNSHQRLLLHVVERAFVIALGAVKLAFAFADDGDIYRQRLGRFAFTQSGDAEEQYQAAVAGRVVTTETNSYTAVRPHGTGALHAFVAPIEFGFYYSG